MRLDVCYSVNCLITLPFLHSNIDEAFGEISCLRNIILTEILFFQEVWTFSNQIIINCHQWWLLVFKPKRSGGGIPYMGVYSCHTSLDGRSVIPVIQCFKLRLVNLSWVYQYDNIVYEFLWHYLFSVFIYSILVKFQSKLFSFSTEN